MDVSELRTTQFDLEDIRVAAAQHGATVVLLLDSEVLDLVGQHRLCERVHGARKDATPPKRLRHPDVRHDEAAGVRGVPRAHGRGELQLEGDEDLLGLVPNRQLIRPRGGARPLQSA